MLWRCAHPYIYTRVGGGKLRLDGAEGRAAAGGVRVRLREAIGGAAEGRQAHHQRQGRDRAEPGA